MGVVHLPSVPTSARPRQSHVLLSPPLRDCGAAPPVSRRPAYSTPPHTVVGSAAFGIGLYDMSTGRGSSSSSSDPPAPALLGRRHAATARTAPAPVALLPTATGVVGSSRTRGGKPRVRRPPLLMPGRTGAWPWHPRAAAEAESSSGISTTAATYQGDAPESSAHGDGGMASAAGMMG
ncbi:unnamed protein product [Urochloa humidicola]